MSVISLVGSVERVRDSLANIKDVIEYRKSAGWSILHYTEEWLYITFPDRGMVCPVCEGYEGRIFAGDEVAAEFPFHVYGGEGTIYPHTHEPDLSQFADTPCHCEMHIQNPAESIEKRLHEEKLAAVAL